MNTDNSLEQGVAVRQYGLLEPLNWGADVNDELYRMHALWNKLVEIERDNRAKYITILGESSALHEITVQIKALQDLRESVISDRNSKRAAVRSKTKADTSEHDAQLKEIKANLHDLYQQSKALSKAARLEQKPRLDRLELERKELVKLARQQSGCFWSNYNAVMDAYMAARKKTLQHGGELRFRRFNHEGRLVNQIQGGLRIDDLFACQHSQVGIRLSGESRGRQTGILYITAFTGVDTEGRRTRRVVEFPIILHRPFPADAIIKSVSVSIRRRSATVTRRLVETDSGTVLERGIPEYSVAFTCRAPVRDATETQVLAAGINIGWKRVDAGLRVATVAYSDGSVDHLVLPNDWIKKWDYVQELKSTLDNHANELHAKLRESLAELPVWREDGSGIEGLSDVDHRMLSNIKCAPKTPISVMDRLAWRLKESPNLPYLTLSNEAIEEWRKLNKRITLEMNALRTKLSRRRQDLYRVFAAGICTRAAVMTLDATNYQKAAVVNKSDGEDPELHESARKQRFMVAPYELRLAIEQSAARDQCQLMRYDGKINTCSQCGSGNSSGELIRHCHACGVTWDVDENAARNLLATWIAEPLQAVPLRAVR